MQRTVKHVSFFQHSVSKTTESLRLFGGLSVGVNYSEMQND